MAKRTKTKRPARRKRTAGFADKHGLLPEEVRLRRQLARTQLAIAKAAEERVNSQLAAHAAADTGRRNRDWRGQYGSADLAVLDEYPILIARARDLDRNSHYVGSIKSGFTRNVIGRGIDAVPAIKLPDAELAAAVNKQVHALWWDWASTPDFCDIEGKVTFWQMQSRIIDEWVVVGNHFIVLSYVPIPHQSQVGLRLQSFEPEQLDDTLQTWNGNEVRHGVEVDRYGAAVAYHFYEKPLNDYSSLGRYQSIRIPRDRVIHFATFDRARQTLGSAPIWRVMQRIRDFHRRDEAELMASMMEACVGMAITKNLPSSPGYPSGIGPFQSGDRGTTNSGMRTFDFVPGMVAELEPGEDVKFLSPQRPGNTYKPFVDANLRAIGAGVGMSFSQIARQSDSSYSAARQDMLQDIRVWRVLQDAMIDVVVTRVYEQWLRLAINEGLIDGLTPADAANSNITEAVYTVDPHEWIDPQVELDAIEKELKLKLRDRSSIVASRGGRYPRTLQLIAEERQTAEAMGIRFPEDVDTDAKLAEAKADAAKAESDSANAEAVSQGKGDPSTVALRDSGWRTINGAKVQIGDDGTIVKGPAKFIGKKPNEVPSGRAVKEKTPSARLAVIPDEVPSYRDSDSEMKCSTCAHAVGMYCKAYDFHFSAGKVCDAWEALPPNDMEPSRKVTPPLRPEGQPSIGSPSGFVPAARSLASDEEHWVTINGAPVLIGEDGEAKSGSAKGKPIGSDGGKGPVMTESEAAEWREKGEVPEGWYVHGRAGRQDLETGNVIQVTRDWNVAEQYAGDDGSEWMLRPNADAKILSSSDTSAVQDLVQKLRDDYENGALTPHLDSLIQSADEDWDRIAEDFNPPNLVDSAGWYDDRDMCGWIYDRMGIDAISVEDGEAAVILNRDAFKAVKVPK